MAIPRLNRTSVRPPRRHSFSSYSLTIPASSPHHTLSPSSVGSPGSATLAGSPTMDSPHFAGMGARGKPFVVATLVHIYLTTALLRALTISTWLIARQPLTSVDLAPLLVPTTPTLHPLATPSNLPTALPTVLPTNTQLTVTAAAANNPSAPKPGSQMQRYRRIRAQDVDVRWLIGASLAVAVSVQVSFCVRLAERAVRWCAIVGVVGTAVHGGLAAAAVAVFVARCPHDAWEAGAVMSQGLLAAATSVACSAAVVGLLAWDVARFGGSNEHVGRSRRKLIISAIIASWVACAGGLLFHAVEGIDYEDAYAFVLTTLLTIGYGNVAPRTPAGRVLLFFYFFAGIGSFSLFFQAVEEHLAEKSRWQVERRERAARARAIRAELGGGEGVAAKGGKWWGGWGGWGDGAATPVEADPRPSVASGATSVGGREAGGEAGSRWWWRMREGVGRWVARVMTSGVPVRRLGEMRGGDGAEEGGRVDTFETLNGSGENVGGEGRAAGGEGKRKGSRLVSAVKGLAVKKARDDDAAEVKKAERYKLYSMMGIILAWWLVSAKIFEVCEPDWTYMDALYFTFVTMTTIGYGDLVPTSPWSWEFWNVFVFTGIATFAFLLTLIQARYVSRFAKAEERVERRVARRRERRLNRMLTRGAESSTTLESLGGDGDVDLEAGTGGGQEEGARTPAEMGEEDIAEVVVAPAEAEGTVDASSRVARASVDALGSPSPPASLQPSNS
ncbi:Potassium channel [Phlyctochytrium bullatum]|nr:Potassium channel [Phlyctochytrium bullatum]